MTEPLQGAHSFNDNSDFQNISDPSFYAEEGEPDQLYLESVLPQAYDPELEPFNSYAVNPKEYPEQNEFGFHPKPKNPYAYTFDNGDKFFTPENKEQTM